MKFWILNILLLWPTPDGEFVLYHDHWVTPFYSEGQCYEKADELKALNYPAFEHKTYFCSTQTDPEQST